MTFCCYLDVVKAATGGSFDVEGQEIQLDRLAWIQSDDVDALLVGRIRRRIVGRLQHSGRAAERSTANRLVTRAESAVSDGVIRAELNQQLIALRRDGRRKIVPVAAVTADQWAVR